MGQFITNIPVRSLEEAIEKIDWYTQRWKIETFHEILKSGCRAEDSKLRNAQRLTRLISIFCILSWRIFWLTMLNRTTPLLPASLVFTSTEIKILDTIISAKNNKPVNSIACYLNKLAKIGRYLNRGKDPLPGNIVVWRGFAKLTEILIGFELARICG
ncbi:MAG: hypothetical protein GY730_11120 [bacterium]|nr:hypothetical protein [bacterium]